VVVQPGGYAVLGRGGDFAQNGGVNLDYNYFSGSASTIWLDNTDWLALRDAGGVTVDSVRWTNAASFTRGVSRALRDPAADNSNVDGPNWGHSTTTFGDGDFGTPGAANGTISSTPPAVPNSISFSGRLASEPPLPVGYEDQLFATLRNSDGVALPTTWTWESVTPATASIDARGVLRSLGPGTAIVRATAADGTSRTYSLPTTLGTSSTTAAYANHVEFGDPADADPSDDFILRRTEFTSSYNVTRGIPNWVSYNLEATHIGAEDRCDCFTFDEALPATFPRYNTADYTGAGAFHGYGIDRGHLVRSFDRTAGDLDNAATFLFTNIVPQAADNNQGPWAVMETYLTDLARFQNREVYVIAGVSGSLGTIKDEGRITIPSHLWKVAVIMPRDRGLADVVRYTDLEVVAVIMPNIPGIRNVDWNTYRTTVDAVEALSGYDLLALLPDHIEIAVESGTHPPVAVIGGATSGAEGSALALDATGSSDLDGHALTFAWSFGDGNSATGSSVTHTWTRDGAYTVQLVATDILGLADTTTVMVSILNVAPVLAPLAGAALLPGETYVASGAFTDPGEDSWTATVDYGDGAGAQPLALNGKSFSLSHVYNAAGSYTVTVTVSDGSASASTSAAVTVSTPASALASLLAAVNQLGADGQLSAGNTSALRATLNAATQQVQAGNRVAAAGQLRAFINQVEAFVRSGRLTAAQGQALIDGAQRIIDALN
jgi:DNA/RNA endonuclease G (NUC1)